MNLEEIITSNSKIILANCDCFECMELMKGTNSFVDIILTSPPYNTSRSRFSDRAFENYEARYDIYVDKKTNEEYIKWIRSIFGMYNNILKDGGVILFNLSYSSENTETMWLVIADILSNTDFTIADDIIWKKSSSLPNNVSSNKLTRIVEHVFVFCRKVEFNTFKCNKAVKSRSGTGQKYYENIFNFIEARNNDGACKLNKATFSSDLVKSLLSIYARAGSKIYDSFMGTGTTAVGCMALGFDCIGSETSKAQWVYSIDRVKQLKTRLERKKDKIVQ